MKFVAAQSFFPFFVTKLIDLPLISQAILKEKLPAL